MGMSDAAPDNSTQTSFERWLHNRSEAIQNYSDDTQHSIFTQTQDLMKSLLKKKDFTIHIDRANRLNFMHAFTEAAKIVGPKLGNVNTRLTAIDSNGRPSYEHLQPNTINVLDDLFNNPNFDRIEHYDDFTDTVMDISELRVEFIPLKTGKRKTAGFFPFINTTDIDLTRYGIFTNTHEDDINESCLIQSLKASGMVSENDLNMVSSFMKTREIPLTILRDVCELLKIHIYIQYDKPCFAQLCCNKPSEKQTNHQDYGLEYKHRGTVKLFILYNHFILNEPTNISKTYINRYTEINNDHRFKSHPRKTLLNKFDENRYSFSKEGLSSVALIKLMLEKGMLVPMSDADISRVLWSYKPKEASFECVSRPVSIKPKRFKGTIKQGVHFFGYKPEDTEVDVRLQELQDVIDSLPLRNHVDVSFYHKFSELMQRVMFEFGCFDNVYEIAGKDAQELRAACVFPRTHTYNNKPLYLKKRLYYIDLNGAYMSAVESIPTGERGNLTKSKFAFANGAPNTRVKELIQTLYSIRKQSNHKLSTTIKCMMNSCYGYSIRRPKIVKRKYAKNLQKVIDEMNQFVYKYSYDEAGSEGGWVNLIESFVPHFTIPQFAKSVLDTFHKKMDEVKSLVTIYYENIDAILIDEDDYNKLLQMGYIGTNLGQFKIEQIFTEIAIKSARKYVATLDNGERFYHCVKDSIDYDDFVSDVQRMAQK